MMSYNIFLLAPEGAEHLSTVVVATDEDDALNKAKSYPMLEPYCNYKFTVLNLSEHFRNSGYDISIIKSNGLGLYH